MAKRKLFRNAVLAAIAPLAAGCISVGPEYQPPETEGIQDAWMAGDPDVLAPGAVEGSAWWEEFEDPLLDALLADAAESNLDLAEARASLDIARAGVQRARASGFPMGELTGSVTRQKQSSASFGGNIPFEFEPQTTYSAGAQGSWEADFFGRVSNSVAQAEAALGGRAAMAEDAARAILAQTAVTYVTLRELTARRAINERSLDRQLEVLELTRQLRDAGEVADLDVERQSNLVDTTRAGLAALETARAETLTGLARLTGRTAPDFVEAYPDLSDPGTVLASLDPETAFAPVRTGEPVDMLRRRPDIRAAERELAAATYGVKVAMAELYPSISLAGSASLTALEPENLFTEAALGYNFGPQISWGIFNLPLLRANIAQSEAEAEAARLSFRNTVLTALTETDAALQSYNGAVEEAALRARALQSAERTLELIEIRYREGAESLLSLIDAQRQALSAEDAEAQARYEALRQRIDVHLALGG